MRNKETNEIRIGDICKVVYSTDLKLGQGALVDIIGTSKLYYKARYHSSSNKSELSFRKNNLELVQPCNHMCNGKYRIEYDDTYEMRPNDMHCEICGRRGSREELTKQPESVLKLSQILDVTPTNPNMVLLAKYGQEELDTYQLFDGTNCVYFEGKLLAITKDDIVCDYTEYVLCAGGISDDFIIAQIRRGGALIYYDKIILERTFEELCKEREELKTKLVENDEKFELYKTFIDKAL